MNELAKDFINKVKTGQIVVNVTDEINFNNAKVLRFSNPNDSSFKLIRKVTENFPEAWDCFDYPDGKGSFLWRSNDFMTQFVAVDPDNTRGCYALGDVKTTKGIRTVDGGWSSRASMLYKYSGIKLIPVVIDNVATHLHMDIMKEIAEHLGLIIDISPYTSNMDEEGEKSWGLYKKDVDRCPKCGKPMGSTYDEECRLCN